MHKKNQWQSFATAKTLSQRSAFLASIRRFFETRGVIEVDTPLLMQGVNTDPFINAFQIDKHFLQTSPEFAMKRLLAQKVGAIYYLGKAFRNEEMGRYHNPEFTMLEWYRPGWDHWQLIEEVGSLFQELFETTALIVKTYAELFSPFNINPHSDSVETIESIAHQLYPIEKRPDFELDRNGWLDWIFMHSIEPHFNPNEPLVVTDFPVSCAQLAQLIPHEQYGKVAARFEVFYQGMELANGYFELTDADEQRQRFVKDNQTRIALQKAVMPIDEKLLAALESGIGKVSGVAIGVDRLLMIQAGATHIKEVMPFYWEIS